jgi:hypothetical protein
MAIKGLTDQEAALPRIGILRKGAKKPANGPGKDLTYFRFVGEDLDAQELFNKAYPEQEDLRRINVFLPFKTPEENFIDNSWIEKWVAGGLEYRSDGDNLVLWRMDNGQYSDEPKPDPKPQILDDGKRADGSMQVGRLTVVIPELGRLASVTILTTSKNDVINLSKQLKAFYALNGDLRGIPFVVVRRKHKISTPMKGGKRGRRESWLLSIETQPHYTRLHLASVQQAALPETVDASEVEILPPTVEVEKIASPDEPTQPPKPKSSKPKPKKSSPAQPAPGFPTIVAEVNAELGEEKYNVYHAQKAIQKVIDDFKIPGPDDTEGLAVAKKTLLEYARAPEQADLDTARQEAESIVNGNEG